MLEPGETARADFLHWAWQIKFEAAKNTAHHVDKMLHACGGSGYKRDMELERYVRDAKAGWVMGPTNEVLRQFVGKAVLLGFDALDYWNQTYNRRVVENEVKKLDAAGKRELAKQLMRAGREGRGEREPAAEATLAPLLLTPGLKPVDPAFESWWVRPGGGHARRACARGDRLTVHRPDGGQPAELTCSRRGAGPGGARRRARRRGPGDGPRRDRTRASAEDARAIRLFAPDGPPGALGVVRRRARATVVVAAPGGRVVDGDWPASALVVEITAPTPRPREEIELPRAARRAAARLPRRPGDRARLRGPRGRVHPDHRRRGPPVLGLPRLQRAQAGAGGRARPRRRRSRGR